MIMEEDSLKTNKPFDVHPTIISKSKGVQRFKITIPRPFNFMERSENKCKKDLMQARHLQMKHKAEEKQRNDEIELLKQFRANPIPVHTFLPLYDEIMHEQDQRRQASKEHFKQQLISYQKPFSLSQGKTGKRRSFSVPELMSPEQSDDNAIRLVTDSKALHASKRKNYKPLSEISTEEEILRQIRIKSRAEKLLKESSLPFSSPRSLIKRPNKEKSDLETFGGHLVSGMPAMSTLTPGHSPCRNKRHFDVTSRNTPKSIPKENVPKVPQQRRRSKSCSSANAKSHQTSFVLSPRMTYAARLRERASREQLKNYAENQQSHPRRPEVSEVKKAVLISILATPKKSISSEEKQQRFREANKIRLLEYQKELQEMNERVKARPLLMQRQSQLSAVQKVERQFRERLQKQGLDEAFIFANRMSHLVSSNLQVSTTSDECHSDMTLSEQQLTEANSPSEQHSSNLNAQSEDLLNKQLSDEEEVTNGSSIEESFTSGEIPERDYS